MGVLSTLICLVMPKTLTGLMLLGTLITVGVMNPFVGVLVLIVTAVLFQSRENYGVLEATGIPVVTPTLFRGSEPNLHRTVLHLQDIERFRKFGGVWGVRTYACQPYICYNFTHKSFRSNYVLCLFQSYVGRTPQIYIADPEIIRLVFVKDFLHFGDARELDMGSPMLNEILNFQPGKLIKSQFCMYKTKLISIY